MTYDNFEEIFQLIKEDMTKENIKMNINIGLRESYQSYVFLLNIEQFNIDFFSRLGLLHFFFSLITSLIVLFPKKTSCKKKSPNLSSIR